MSSKRQRLLPVIALGAVCLLVSAAPASAETYGQLLVRHAATPSGALATHFTHARPPSAFLLVVTEPEQVPLEFSWSVRCVGTKPKESGGATGRAIVASGHWVKRIKPSWIKHPVSCSGTIEGAAGTSPVLVRVFAAR
jgi:hypothetical protein